MNKQQRELVWEIHWHRGCSGVDWCGKQLISAESETEARILFRERYPGRHIEKTVGPIKSREVMAELESTP
jgi:hypothetical protein